MCSRLDRAAAAYERALELVPELPSAQANLATVYLLKGRADGGAGPLAHPAQIAMLRQRLDPALFDLDALEERLQALTQLEVSSVTVLSVAVDLCRKHWL